MMSYEISWREMADQWSETVEARSFCVERDGHVVFYDDFAPVAAYPPGWDRILKRSAGEQG